MSGRPSEQDATRAERIQAAANVLASYGYASSPGAGAQIEYALRQARAYIGGQSWTAKGWAAAEELDAVLKQFEMHPLAAELRPQLDEGVVIEPLNEPATVAALRDALLKYGRHRTNCACHADDGTGCDCGYYKSMALAEIDVLPASTEGSESGEPSERTRGVITVEPDVLASFDEFWRDIVMPNGEWDHAQIMRELADYRLLLHEVPKVYDNLTGGRISKPNTIASAVIGEADEYMNKLVEERVEEELADRAGGGSA